MTADQHDPVRQGFRRVTALSILLAVAGGCGGAHESSVTGIVYLDNEPLYTGMVTFHPTEGGPSVYGVIGEDGRYELKTGSEKGLASGEYHVTVMATEPPPPTAQGVAPPQGKRITPERYGRVETTDLVETITSGSNKIDIRLTSK